VKLAVGPPGRETVEGRALSFLDLEPVIARTLLTAGCAGVGLLVHDIGGLLRSHVHLLYPVLAVAAFWTPLSWTRLPAGVIGVPHVGTRDQT